MRHLLALTGLLLALALPAEAANLLRTHVMSDGRGYLLSFRFDQAIAFRHFTLATPDRLVIDLPSSVKGEQIANLKLEDGLVGGVRYGQHPNGELRIVVDLGAPVTYAIGTLEGQPEVLRLTLIRAPTGRFEQRALPAVAPPDDEREESAPALSEPPPPVTAEPPPAATSVEELKCLRLVDTRHDDCAELIDEVSAVSDNPYPNDAPPPPDATFELDRPAPKEEPQGSLGVHRFLKRTGDGKRRTDIGYKTQFGDTELGVSLLRPSLTWEREAVGGDLRFLLRPDELQLGYQKQWQ